MTNIISEYQKWKQQGEDLRIQAKTAMESRYRELFLEAIQIAEEYRADFGAALKPPAAVTAFRYKAAAKGKAAKGKAGSKSKPGANGKPDAKPSPVKVETAPPSPKTAALQRKLETARKKLEAAKAAGTPTKNLEDRVYEIEDDLRLSMQSGA